MNYEVVLSLDAVEDVLRITMASGSKSQVINASTFASGTSADQYPSSSGARGIAVLLPPLNVPATAMERANGAQTLNVTPSR